MKGSARTFSRLCSGILLLLCIAACVSWARSYTHITAIIFARSERFLYGVSAVQGGFYVGRQAAPTRPQPTFVNAPLDPDAHLVDESSRYAGFAYMREPDGAWILRVSCWLLPVVAPALVLPGFLRHRRQRRRLSTNLCPACGYDLRASPDRCPECGAVPVGGAT